MPRIRFAFIAFAVITATCLFGWVDNSWCQPKQSSDAIENFSQVTQTLFRGAQPSAAGFTKLRDMGVGIIVNFRDEAGETADEKKQVESLGMKYVGIPWSGRQYPSSAQIIQFLDLVRTNPQAKIFVHCQRGADRTGTMIAAYRIAIEHKTVANAVSEMHQFHYDHFFLPQLERYINSLPSLIQTDTLFSAYAPVAGSMSAAAAPAGTLAVPAAQ
jgi:protein tyrosine/serine phosphatase